MIDVFNLLSEKWFELMWRVTWQGGIFIGIIFLITRIFKRLSPTIKHILWMLVIVKFLIMPFITVQITPPAFPSLVRKPLITHIAETHVVTQESGVISESSPVLPSEELPLAINVSHPEVTFQLPSVLSSIWLCGIIILIFGIAFRSIRLKKDISTAKVLEDKNVLNIVTEGVNEFRIMPPTLKISDKFKSPLACGIIRPVIIFPEHIIGKFMESELRAIIYHELAHIKRKDILTNWFQILTQILYFFNPLVWYANRQIRIEREQACDDWVLEGGKEERKSYADALLKVVEICSVRERFALGIVGVSETFTLMARRVKMIMDSGRKINTRLSVKVIIGLVIVSVVTMPSCTEKKSLNESSVSLEHYRNAWLKHLGSPTGKPGWEKEAAEKAVAEFQKAIDLEPDNAMFRQSLAFAFEKLGEIAKAEEGYKKAIELMPQDSFLHYALARLYAKDKNNQDKAISELKIAIQQNPDEALFHYHLAHILYMEAGKYQKEYLITDEKLSKEAFEEVQEGNNKTQFTQYMPPFPKDVSSKMDYIRVINLWSGENLPELLIMRDIARMNMALGGLYRTQDDVGKTEEIYLSTLVMGKRFAEQNPLALIKMLVGIKIDSMARNGLEELYSAQGMQEKIQWVKEGKEEFKIIQKLSREKTDEMLKHASYFWEKKERELKAKEKDLLFLEASFVREMLNRWPVINECLSNESSFLNTTSERLISNEEEEDGKFPTKFQEIIKIAREYLFREKPEMKQVQLEEPHSIHTDSANKLIDVSFLILSEPKFEELEGGSIRTTFPAVIVQIDFTGNLISVRNGSHVTTRYPPEETERLLRSIDGKPEWESIFSVLTSQNAIVLSAACHAIERLGKNAIPKLLEGATDKRPSRYYVHRSDRGKLFSREWYVSEVLKEVYWTIGDLCLGIICDLVEYPLVYNGAISDDMSKEHQEVFRNYIYISIKAWYEKHKDEPQVLTINKEEKEYISNAWREIEKKVLNIED